MAWRASSQGVRTRRRLAALMNRVAGRQPETLFGLMTPELFVVVLPLGGTVRLRPWTCTVRPCGKQQFPAVPPPRQQVPTEPIPLPGYDLT
jgi:hypothetical protein